MAPHGKELSEDLQRCIVALLEDDQGYKKIIQRFKRAGSTQNRVGRPKKLSTRAERHIQMLSLKDRRRSAVSIAAEFEEVGCQPVSAQTIRFALHQIGVNGCHPRRKPLMKTIHKKARKQFAEDMSTKHMDYWNHVLWSDEMKINLFGSDRFKHMWRRPGEEYKYKCVMPTVKHGGGNVMVWGCMRALGVGELHFIEGDMNSNKYCEILLQRMTPSLQKLVRRAVFWAWQWPQTHLQEYLCFNEEAGGKGDGLAKHVSILEPKRTSLRDHQVEVVGGARGVMVIVAGCGHGDTSSNPGPDWFHFT